MREIFVTAINFVILLQLLFSLSIVAYFTYVLQFCINTLSKKFKIC